MLVPIPPKEDRAPPMNCPRRLVQRFYLILVQYSCTHTGVRIVFDSPELPPSHSLGNSSSCKSNDEYTTKPILGLGTTADSNRSNEGYTYRKRYDQACVHAVGIDIVRSVDD